MKVILFGAGKGGENFISQHPEMNIVAIADNDESKHGKTVLDIPVISPAEVKNENVESIIITSQWVDQVHLQLTKDLGLDESLITIPNKQAVKAELPFQDKPTKVFAQNLLTFINQYCREKGAQVCLDSGTLLGAMRDGDLISWDDDIDLAIDPTSFNSLINTLPELVEQLSDKFEVEWKVVVITVNGKQSCINVEFLNRECTAFIPFDLSIQLRESINGSSELVSSGGLFFAPARHFDNLDTIHFLNENFFVPHDPSSFLTFMYGDWQTPKRTTQITEYENRRASLPSPKGGIKVEKHTFSLNSEQHQ
ncbi:LicD family protein [Alteromonas sp. 1_MG-2023]|uniref:LicD family protein n=1 Tax=Alteromonas sp. 1_MG-2023 TaxID=3062669 RepID=UPI0026E38037|nr:LicD family protein [Alteromonas sp. 1_MG-2023]MDO6568444.1 LicD family protein [Alteromonas sp. 1_MG-2023]